MENFSIANLIIGILGMVGGVFMMKEAFYLNHRVLFLGWAERKFGPGHGTTAYTFIGLGIIVFSIFVAIGTIDLAGAISPAAAKPNGGRQVQIRPTSGPTGISE